MPTTTNFNTTVVNDKYPHGEIIILPTGSANIGGGGLGQGGGVGQGGGAARAAARVQAVLDGH